MSSKFNFFEIIKVIGVIFIGLIVWNLFFSSEESISPTISDENLSLLSEADIEEKIKQTIVFIKYEVSGKDEEGSYFKASQSGSGVIVRNDDYELTIFTNRHVVDCEYQDIDCFQILSEEIKVRTSDGEMYTVDKVAYSESDIDLAVLTTATPKAENYSFAYYTKGFTVGDTVIAVGYPSYAENIVELSINEGTITQIQEVLSQSTGEDFRTIESDAYTYFGSSGGGLFDASGNLIGINTFIAMDKDETTIEKSIAIDFSSIEEENFIYCEEGSYFADGECYPLCEIEQVLGNDGTCYDLCENYYCESTIPEINSELCEDSNYILGEDNYCHAACTINTYCPEGICYRNECAVCPSQMYLYEDGSCRY